MAYSFRVRVEAGGLHLEHAAGIDELPDGALITVGGRHTEADGDEAVSVTLADADARVWASAASNHMVTLDTPAAETADTPTTT